VFDSKDREVSEFDLEDIDFLTSKKRTCIGYFDDDGVYLPCPKNAPVEKFAQCPDCSDESFLPREHQDCVFDPKCDGELCNLDFCRREHVLYVAFYDTRMKIGMSSTRRVERRLIEQGADAFAIVGKFPTRKKAREAEISVSVRLGMPQWLRQDVVLRNFARKVDIDGISLRHEGLRMTLKESYNLELESLHWLDGYPLELPLAQVPKLQESWGKHKGRLVGIKGKWLILESDGLKALNLSDFPARFLSREG